MATSSSILLAVANAVKSITTANGYTTNLNPANVTTRLTALDNLQAMPATSYPRVFVISDGAEYQDQPSNRIVKEERFTILAVFAPNRNDGADVALETQVSNFVDDFEVMIGRNKQLGGSDLVQIQTLATDIQTVESEAVAMFEITVIYRRSLS